MPKLSLSPNEYRLLKLNVEKLYKIKCEKAKGTERLKHEYTTTKSLNEKFKTEQVEYLFNRRELRSLEAIAKHMVNLIDSKVIPGYEHRISTDPARANIYQQYIKKVQDTRSQVVLGLIEKIEGAL